MDSLSSNTLPVETFPARKPFLQSATFSQQIHSLGSPLRRAVHAASTNMETSLSRTESGRDRATVKFNFGVGTEGGGVAACRRDHRLEKQCFHCFGR